MAYYGIDLGTSNCIIAKVIQNLDDSFDVKCLTDENGYQSFPSVVYFQNNDQYKVGESAIRHLYNEPDSTVELVKVRIGKTNSVKICTQSSVFNKSPQEISSYVLCHLNNLHGNQIDSAVITVPAFFDQSQKDATMQAATIAGMTPKLLIEEPTAAIMHHIFSEYKIKKSDFFGDKKDKNVLVFDFGGGTLDLSLISVTNDKEAVIPKVLAIGGDTELGGNIIDFIFTKVILKILKFNYKDDSFITEVHNAFSNYYNNYIYEHRLRFDDDVSNEIKNFIFRLKRNLEQTKIKLSSEEKIEIVFEGHYKPITVTRDNFIKAVLQSEDLNIKDRIITALAQISKMRVKVSEVLLIGGSSQIPYVKDIIVEVFEDMGITKDLITMSNDFEQAVAKGAAIQAAITSGVSIPPFMHNKCESIVARDIELEHAGIHSLFVKMGTKYPFDSKKQFDLKIGHSLSESISLVLNEIIVKGDKNYKQQICKFEFFLPVYYSGDDIIISMNIDEAGLYQIEAVHKNTGEVVEFEPHKKFSLSESEMHKTILEVKSMKDIS